MKNTISIVYQGTTTFCEQIPIIDYKTSNDAIFSTWDDEPQKNIDIIANKGYKIILNKKPKNYGFHNLNLQTISTLNGIKETKNDYVIKIRSDMVINPLEQFLDILYKKNKMSFLCFHNHDSGYVCDYINYGEKSDMILWWDCLQQDNQKIPPEVQLLMNFLIKKSISCDYQKYPNIKDIFDFFLLDINKNNVTIDWLKNRIKLNSYINDKLFLY